MTKVTVNNRQTRDSVRTVKRKRRKKKIDERPTFKFRNMPVRAAGILVVSSDVNNNHFWLFRRVNGKYEDIGGKTDLGDTCALDTAVRETVEETKGKLFSSGHSPEECAKELRVRLQSEKVNIQYNPQSKYVMYTLPVESSIMQLPMRRFGRSEKTDWGLLEHYYQWRAQRPYHKQLHYRIRGFRL